IPVVKDVVGLHELESEAQLGDGRVPPACGVLGARADDGREDLRPRQVLPIEKARAPQGVRDARVALGWRGFDGSDGDPAARELREGTDEPGVEQEAAPEPWQTAREALVDAVHGAF